MVFRSAQRKLTSSPAITVDSHLINVSDSVSFLGVHLDANLTFALHIAHIRKTAAFGIRALLKARSYFSHKALLSLYFAFIHSHITYGIASWGNTYQCHLSSLQHLQNRALRVIFNCSRDSSAIPLLQCNNILTVSNLFWFNLIMFLHKQIKNQLSANFIDPKMLVNTNTTRFAANNNFLLPKVHTNYGKSSSLFCTISI